MPGKEHKSNFQKRREIEEQRRGKAALKMIFLKKDWKNYADHQLGYIADRCYSGGYGSIYTEFSGWMFTADELGHFLNTRVGRVCYPVLMPTILQ